MSDGFYRAFEEKHRGPREVIKSRLRAYLPFIKPLVELGKGAKTLDLGCGRGEWIELMTEVGFKSHGVDLDEGMLQACVELGLSVDQGDAIAFLAALPSESQAIVSAFHFVEHISFEQLQNVVSEALRVLRPGGLLIMETPNPENIVVSTCNFYLDPTHLRPIPPQLLSFLPEHLGFARAKTIRLQESKSLIQSETLTLQDVLGGVSPDYAVIAQKTAAAEVLQKLNPAFDDEYGLSLDTLATRYTAQLNTKAHQIEVKAEQAQAKAVQADAKAEQAQAKAVQAETKAWQAEVKAEQAQAKAVQADAKAAQSEAKAVQAETKAWQAEVKAGQAEVKAVQAEVKAGQAEVKAGQAEVKAGQAETKAQQAAAEAGLAKMQAQQAEVNATQAQALAQQFQQALQAMLSSRSWRITAPLRWCGLQARLLREQGLLARTKAFVKKITRPFASQTRASVETPPGAENQAGAPAEPAGNDHQVQVQVQVHASTDSADTPNRSEDLPQLTSRAREINAELKARIENKRDSR